MARSTRAASKAAALRRKAEEDSADLPEADRNNKQEEEKETKEKQTEESFQFTVSDRHRKLIFVLLAIACGSLNAWHGYTLFENDTYFSHLSNLEREMTFRTEMGLYYSYYKTLVHAPTLADGLKQLMANNHTEYPYTINTLKRFNLYPEVVLGVAYRLFNETVNRLGIEAKNCFTISRNELPSVESCAGIGDHAMFYTTSVYLWNAWTGIALVGLAAILSDSILGTLLCCACYFFNYNQATRIQWTPPLRESFAYPLLILQIFITTRLLRSAIGITSCISYVVVTTCCLICWQFSQFALLTEIIALFIVFSVHNSIWWNQLQFISTMHLCSIIIAYMLLLMNDMLFSSLYTAAVVACIIVSQSKILNLERWSLAKCSVQLVSFGVISITIKLFMGFLLQVNDDSHIWNILRSKLSDYRDFHTMLYTCAPEFDFLQIDYFWSTYNTIGISLLVAVTVVTACLIRDTRKRQEITPEILYNVYQCIAFAIMALTLMRLKMFLTPHLCLLSSLAVSRKFVDGKFRLAIAIALLSTIVVPGYVSITKQHSFVGEYTNPNMEELLTFIDDYAEPMDSFAGPMPLMANILLSTGRPIVNHPHYENALLREKTALIYTLLSRRSVREVYGNLKKLQVSHVVLPKGWCFGQLRTGCKLVDIWDEIDPANKLNTQVCEKLINDETEGLFEKVFKNDEYTLLSLM